MLSLLIQRLSIVNRREPSRPAARSTTGEKTRKNLPLEGLRGLAALMVFIVHLERGITTSQLGNGVAIGGGALAAIESLECGIDLFFLISGYVIIGSLVRHGNALEFLYQRVRRMYPLFLVTHLLLFTAGPIVGYAWLGEVGWREWLLRFVQNLLLLPGVFDLPIAQAVAWSLSYELLFYLIAAAGYSACTARVPRAVRGLLGAFAIGAAVWALSQSPTVWFFVGGALLHAVRSDVIRWFVARPGWASVLGIAGFAGMLVATRLSATVALAAGTMCFATLVAERGWLSRVLAQRWITHLGQISYSFYLWQLIVMFVVKRVAIAAMPVVGPTGAVVLFVAGSTVLSLMVAQLSYRWIEVSLAALLFDRRRKESQRSMARAA